jgi:hypothetical protein
MAGGLILVARRIRLVCSFLREEISVGTVVLLR